MTNDRDLKSSNVTPAGSQEHPDLSRKESFEDQKELLRQVSLKEKELADMIEKARQKAKEIVDEAKTESANLLNSGRTVTTSEMDTFLEEGMREVEVRVKQIKKSNDAENKALRKKAAGRIEEVARQVVEALLPVP